MLVNLAKSLVSLAAAPVALIADLVTLPSSAYDDRHPFGMTGELLATAKANLDEAIKPQGPQQ